MAGQRLTGRMFDALEAHVGEDRIFGLLADGETVSSVCRKIKELYPDELGELSRGVLSTWCNRPERKERYLEARRMGAVAYAEDSLEIADGAPLSKEGISKAKLRADTRKWIAGKLDRDAWGEQTQAGVTVNIGQMHLNAVRELSAERERAIEHDRGEVIEADWTENLEDDWLN